MKILVKTHFANVFLCILVNVSFACANFLTISFILNIILCILFNIRKRKERKLGMSDRKKKWDSGLAAWNELNSKQKKTDYFHNNFLLFGCWMLMMALKHKKNVNHQQTFSISAKNSSKRMSDLRKYDMKLSNPHIWNGIVYK